MQLAGTVFVGLSVAASSCATTEVQSGSDPALVEVTTTLTLVPSTTTVPTSRRPATASTTSISNVAATRDAATPAGSVAPLSGWAAVDQYLEATFIRGGSAAASVAVLRNGELQHSAAYGHRIAGEVAKPSDRFRVASISKTILAVAALKLVEDGVLELDAPVGSLLATGLAVSSPTGGTEAITLRHLLTHRSGFPRYENLFFRNEAASCPDAARAGFRRSLQSVAGTLFQYSNMNFCVLGLLIEQVTGSPYEQVVQEEVLDPLAITSMRTAGTFDIEPGDVEHKSGQGRNYMEVLAGAGAWLAAPTDLVTILNSLDLETPGVKVLKPATLEMMAMITVTPPSDDDEALSESAPTTMIAPALPTQGYGMGLRIFDAPPTGGAATTTFGHTGTLESTHAMFVRRPDGITWAVTISGDYPVSTPEIATIIDNALLFGGFTDDAYRPPPPPLDEG
jgi:D-alanyl-D-alanine carboxypeptidase